MSAHLSPGPALDGFEAISRSWLRRFDVFAATIGPGEFYVTVHEEAIVTVLGSCITACVRDPVSRIGGMNHFMLPTGTDGMVQKWSSSCVDGINRYGNFAMENLINSVLRYGGSRDRLEIKLFGGGRVIENFTTDIGKRNIEFARSYLSNEGFEVVAEDVGDVFPRKVIYFPLSGVVKVKKIGELAKRVREEEEVYLKEIDSHQEDSGEIDLF